MERKERKLLRFRERKTFVHNYTRKERQGWIVSMKEETDGSNDLQ